MIDFIKKFPIKLDLQIALWFKSVSDFAVLDKLCPVIDLHWVGCANEGATPSSLGQCIYFCFSFFLGLWISFPVSELAPSGHKFGFPMNSKIWSI